MSLLLANNANLWGKTSKPFVTEWTVPDNTTVTLPHLSGYVYSYFVDWGDGTPRKYVAAYNDPNASHTYAVAGTYEVKIVGTCEAFFVNNGSMKSYITKLTEFGSVGVKNLNFYGCSNMIYSIPEDSTGLNELIFFNNGFRGCTGITGAIPSTFLDTAVNLLTVEYLFHSCTGITGAIPSTFLDNCVNLTYATYLFYSCTGITGAIPSTFLDNCVLLVNILGMFRYCTGITGAIPATFLDNAVNLQTVELLFYQCTGITGAIPPTFLDNCTLLNNVNACFINCLNMTGEIPSTFLDNCTLLTSISNLFYNCKKLSGAAKEYWLNPQYTVYSQCYYNDTQLTNYESIPATWK